MSRLLALRTAVVEGVRAATGFADVGGHYGRFTEEQLRQFLTAAPAIRVAVLGLADPAQTPDVGVADYEAQLGVYVATRDKATVGGRDELAIAAVEAVCLVCDRNAWGLRAQGVRPGRVAGARNLYSEKNMQDGMALWAVDLRQPVRIAPTPEAEGELRALYLGYAPEVGTGHEADYILIAGEAA